MYKFSVFCNFSLNVDQMQCPVTLSSQGQPDHPAFLWQTNLVLMFSINTLMGSHEHPRGS